MTDDKKKTKSEMLLELESIKGLLLEDDDIPLLQDSFDADTQLNDKEQQDLFNTRQFNHSITDDVLMNDESSNELLETLTDLEILTDTVTHSQFNTDKNKPLSTRPTLAKAQGENPFLPQHIRTRLHGNNPPPLFAEQTAHKIAQNHRSTTLLGNTKIRDSFSQTRDTNITQQDLINELITALLPEIENKLRSRLEAMSKEILEALLREKE